MATSIRNAHPLSGLPKDLQDAYLQQLSGEARQNFIDGEKWYRKVYGQ